MNPATPFGFRIVGPCSGDRRLVDWQAAFSGYADCVQRARVELEAYLSAFTFGPDFRDYLKTTGSTRGYNGSCGAAWLWFDIDRDPDAGGVAAALQDARKLAVALSDRYGVDDAAQLWFYSGSKGFHVGIRTDLWAPEPSIDFHRIARCFAEAIAEAAGVVIDTGVYDKVRAFRAPNSRHPKTGRHKRCLIVDELMRLTAEAIVNMAGEPMPFELPDSPPESSDFLTGHWNTASRQVREQAEAAEYRRADRDQGNGEPTLNRLTLQFIREGANQGDRHRLLYSAARNLSELGCPPALAHALLTESALDSGLPPAEVRRQIGCGLKDGRGPA